MLKFKIPLFFSFKSSVQDLNSLKQISVTVLYNEPPDVAKLEVVWFNNPGLLGVPAPASVRNAASSCFFSFLGWGETESTWYVGQYFAYCTSPG
jgi:hypothetical protein